MTQSLPPRTRLRAVPALAAVCVLGVGGGALWRTPVQTSLAASGQAIGASAAAAPSDRPVFDLSLPGLRIDTPARSAANHSPSLAALADGGLAMAWFGGSREGARDVQIFFARFDGKAWSEARPVLSTDSLIKASGRFVSKLGNPVLMAQGHRLHLWFVVVSAGGWGGARLSHMVSEDGGSSWSRPALLVTSPFMNVSTLVRATGLNRSPDILLPAYFELSLKYPVMLRLDPAGRLVDRYPFGGRSGLLQPSVVSSDAGAASLTAYMRRGMALSDARVHRTRSADGGLHWEPAEAVDVPNGDASVTAWADGPVHWLAANPEVGNRHAMAIYQLAASRLSPDDGIRAKATGSAAAAAAAPATSIEAVAMPAGLLQPLQVLDRQLPQPDPERPGKLTHSEFSYPSFARTSDGRLHLVYTAEGRRTIRHWVWAPKPPPSAAPSAPGGKP